MARGEEASANRSPEIYEPDTKRVLKNLTMRNFTSRRPDASLSDGG